MPRQYFKNSTIFNTALNHAENIDLVRVTNQHRLFKDELRQLRQALLIMKPNRCKQRFLFWLIRIAPVEFFRQNICPCVSMINAGAVVKCLILAILGEARHIVQKTDRVGERCFCLSALSQASSQLQANFADSSAALFFHSKHRLEFSALYKAACKIFKPRQYLLCIKHLRSLLKTC